MLHSLMRMNMKTMMRRFSQFLVFAEDSQLHQEDNKVNHTFPIIYINWTFLNSCKNVEKYLWTMQHYSDLMVNNYQLTNCNFQYYITIATHNFTSTHLTCILMVNVVNICLYNYSEYSKYWNLFLDLKEVHRPTESTV